MDFIAGWPLLSFRESQGCKAVWLTVERQRGSDATSSPGFCPGVALVAYSALYSDGTALVEGVFFDIDSQALLELTR